MMGATKSKVPWCKRVTKHVIYEQLAEDVFYVQVKWDGLQCYIDSIKKKKKQANENPFWESSTFDTISKVVYILFGIECLLTAFNFVIVEYTYNLIELISFEQLFSIDINIMC
ncbi:hypothetical protein HanIR_Chr17g0859091 [Helianthus annuus]|nr:hypothetical protein HanIR_Chr17g0859091 [Helianthus annuus]